MGLGPSVHVSGPCSSLLLPGPTAMSCGTPKMLSPSPLVFDSNTSLLEDLVFTYISDACPHCPQMAPQYTYNPAPHLHPQRFPAVCGILPQGCHPTCIHIFKIWRFIHQTPKPEVSLFRKDPPFPVPGCCLQSSGIPGPRLTVSGRF